MLFWNLHKYTPITCMKLFYRNLPVSINRLITCVFSTIEFLFLLLSSYLHCRWADLVELEKDKRIHQKVKRFKAKQQLNSFITEVREVHVCVQVWFVLSHLFTFKRVSVVCRWMTSLLTQITLRWTAFWTFRRAQMRMERCFDPALVSLTHVCTH